MGFIDLHVHSNASDGTMSPSQVVVYAGSKGLSAIALTDHDTVSGIPEALEAAQNTELKVIPGIELSCVCKGTEIHILGLFLDISQRSVFHRLDFLKQIRADRNDKMLQLFAKDGIIITLDELSDNNPDTIITRAHFARVLVEKGYAKTMDQAFKQYLTYGGPYCLHKEDITPELAMDILTDAHAFPILAHPLLYHMGYEEIETLLAYLKTLGLKGLEVYHSSNNQYESMRLKELSKKYELLPSGGSDFHGTNKPDIDIGKGRGGLRISDLLLRDIEQNHFNWERNS